MQIRPILATLRRHKLTAVLLALQVALTCAIVTNAVFLIAHRIALVTAPSGLEENTMSVVQVDDLDVGANPRSLHLADLAALRRLPGVESAALISHVPFADSQDSTGACVNLAAAHAALKARGLVPGCAETDEYWGGPGTLRSLGLKLVAGRAFAADEYVAGKPGQQSAGREVPAAILSLALAQRLYPSHPDQAVGRVVYFGESGLLHGKGTRVVGIVEHLHRADSNEGGTADQSMLLPIEPNSEFARFALRSRPSDRARVIHGAVAALEKARPERQISADDARTYTQIRTKYFRGDTTMIRLLLAAALGLLFVTALGIAGLASFWVGQRTRSIGIRRAIGATRGDILRYFQTENFLIVTFGIVLGVILAVGLNLLLMQHYEVLHLPYWYLPVGAVVLWLLGQLAVLAPALRAANVPPVVATRSV